MCVTIAMAHIYILACHAHVRTCMSLCMHSLASPKLGIEHDMCGVHVFPLLLKKFVTAAGRIRIGSLESYQSWVQDSSGFSHESLHQRQTLVLNTYQHKFISGQALLVQVNILKTYMNINISVSSPIPVACPS